MTSEQIEKFLQPEFIDVKPVQISFKTRQGIKGIFNLWRIVSESKIEEYGKSKNSELARIFNGVEFTRLTLV